MHLYIISAEGGILIIFYHNGTIFRQSMFITKLFVFDRVCYKLSKNFSLEWIRGIVSDICMQISVSNS